MRGIPFQTSEYTIHKHFESILHAPPFSDMWKMGYPMNFTIFLHHRKPSGDRTGTGNIRIPDLDIARLLISQSDSLPTLDGARIKLGFSTKGVDPRDIETLRNSPYQDPEILREQNELDKRLTSHEPLTKLQFGWLDRDQVFSPEWTRSYTGSMSAYVWFDGKRRELAIEEISTRPLGRYQPRRVVMRFGSVKTLSYSRSRDPEDSLLLTLLVPPVFEERIGGNGTKRTRESSLCDDGLHARLVPYTSCAILLAVASKRSRQKILDMCSVVRLPKPTRFLAAPEARDHFAVKTIVEAERFIKALPWPIAFQVLSLLRNRKLSAKELLLLRNEIGIMVQQYRSMPTRAARIVEKFGQELEGSEWLNPSHNSQHRILGTLTRCFRTACGVPSSIFRHLEPPGDLFTCYHVAVTPTSEIPQDPYPDQASLLCATCHESDIEHPVQPSTA